MSMAEPEESIPPREVNVIPAETEPLPANAIMVPEPEPQQVTQAFDNELVCHFAFQEGNIQGVSQYQHDTTVEEATVTFTGEVTQLAEVCDVHIWYTHAELT